MANGVTGANGTNRVNVPFPSSISNCFCKLFQLFIRLNFELIWLLTTPLSDIYIATYHSVLSQYRIDFAFKYYDYDYNLCDAKVSIIKWNGLVELNTVAINIPSRLLDEVVYDNIWKAVNDCDIDSLKDLSRRTGIDKCSINNKNRTSTPSKSVTSRF